MGHHYRPARFEDCREMAPNMRSQDAKEVMASHGYTPYEALHESYKASHEMHSIIHADGSVVGMFGVSNAGSYAVPWMLGTDKLLETKRIMLPVARVWVDSILERYPLLFNYVHADNTVSRRWLKSLGFEFIKLEKEYGVGKEPFIQFVRIKKCVHL
tara:strand:+ start:3901 stop:4371 length:471 start_codon:yes stop_codon:yes gene_type:complete